MIIHNPHIVVPAQDIDTITGENSAKRSIGQIITVALDGSPSPVDIAGIPAYGDLVLWADGEEVGRINDNEIPGWSRSIKRGLKLEQWVILIRDTGQFENFLLSAFRELLGDFPDTDLSRWEDYEKRQERLSKDALTDYLERGLLSEGYFFIDSLVGAMIAKNVDGVCEGKWGSAELKKRPVIVTGPGYP